MLLLIAVALLALPAAASPSASRCWTGAPVSAVGAGQITNLTVGGGQLWVSLLRGREPVPGWDRSWVWR